jgi:hypothetical protein
MSKWAYKILATDPQDYDRDRLIAQLDELGQASWELVAVYDDAGRGDRRFVFKRPA